MQVAIDPTWKKVSGPEYMDPILAENAALENNMTPFIRIFFFLGPKSVVQSFGNDKSGATIELRRVMKLEPQIKKLVRAVQNVVDVRNTGLQV